MFECDSAALQYPDQIIDLFGDERHGRRLVRPGIWRAVHEQRRRSALEGHHLVILHDLGQPQRTLVEFLRLFKALDADGRNCIVIAEHMASPWNQRASSDPHLVTQLYVAWQI